VAIQRGQGAMPSPRKLMTVWRKAGRVAVVVTQCFDIGNDYICRVFATREDNGQCALLQKLQRLWLSHSQPGMSHSADVLEVWTWTYYSAEANTQMGRGMHQITHFEIPKLKKKHFRLPLRPPPHTAPHIHSQPAMPLFLRIRRSTPPPTLVQILDTALFHTVTNPLSHLIIHLPAKALCANILIEWLS